MSKTNRPVYSDTIVRTLVHLLWKYTKYLMGKLNHKLFKQIKQ